MERKNIKRNSTRRTSNPFMQSVGFGRRKGYDRVITMENTEYNNMLQKLGIY